jgi:ABC-type nitrate/sulfonate/bicarbonate transport system substrate-binding protein
MNRVLIGVIAGLVWLAAAGPAGAQGPAKVEVIVFPGGFNWPIWAAMEKGFFAREGLQINITPTPNSVFQLTNMIGGKFDIGMTAIDNIVAYQEGQGEAPVQGTPDLFAFMGGDNGFLRLSVIPEVKTYADLKGKELSVDAMTTGYAFALRKMVERGGLKESDVTYVRAGGVLQRFEALKEKKHAGTMLITPFEIMVESMGFNRLGNAIDVFGHYQGLVGGARRSWAQANPEKAIGYIRGYQAGMTWLYDRGNKAEALQILVKNVRGMTPDLAAKTYDVLLGPGGFDPRAALDIEGVRTVLKLRSEYGEPKKELTDPMRYIDLSYYQKAMQGR